MLRERQTRKLKVSSLDLYVDKHGIRCSRSTLKRDKVDIVNVDLINDEKDDVEDEESDEEYENDVVIGGDSDQEEATDTCGRKVETDEDYREDDNHYEDDEDNDDDDDVRDEDNDYSDDEINVCSEEVQISDILCTTKSGRTCRTWKARYL